MSDCLVFDNEFPLNNRWCQYGLVTVLQCQLCVRRAICSVSFNVTVVYCMCVWSGHVLSVCVRVPITGHLQ